ncbi:hypothetical protein K438DRAFT_1753326 [Mycena galopus ATCC 62051]|nr:hypothetical protein K438DRAFT_1753326 [Mycena galopus ATCC 62051]
MRWRGIEAYWQIEVGGGVFRANQKVIETWQHKAPVRWKPQNPVETDALPGKWRISRWRKIEVGGDCGSQEFRCRKWHQRVHVGRVAVMGTQRLQRTYTTTPSLAGGTLRVQLKVLGLEGASHNAGSDPEANTGCGLVPASTIRAVLVFSPTTVLGRDSIVPFSRRYCREAEYMLKYQ